MARVRIAHVPGHLSATRATRAEHRTLGWSHGCFRGPPRGGGWHGPHVIARSRQREGGRCKAGDTFAHVTCDDRGWPGIARDGHGARTCVVAWVTAARGARAEGTSACHWWGGRSDGHTTLEICASRARATHCLLTMLQIAPWRAKCVTKISVAARIVPNGQMLGAQRGQAVGSDCTDGHTALK